MQKKGLFYAMELCLTVLPETHYTGKLYVANFNNAAIINLFFAIL